ncbi:2-C-methyl-D-erythritol 4-phosphate cytidylyltransferase [Pullulanibacillus sp. KACC 23026]|uniref:2-C-methyl-D-erythritol 4-phosphate cytidylyltransferase n=1 Tax=Pullulanibacillus sp. KACC 23026 TaxID=3028315 RepID=UPI0023B00663|nr:2-C-methyl-D-erythritol 4-phosphate cytidylyltransferase [Pullulanibacillus sp. KACC 23026]WEG12695.1 2-C-methyl-D-erythritol 4-phosphate cytidylyltransferase [Pullulanibacillus sp. KACC 23026]
MNYQVVIPAAGSGKRMGAGQNKLFLSLSGTPIIMRTLLVFEQDSWCKGIILVIKETEREWFEQQIHKHHLTKVLSLISGGKERQHSVYNGLLQATSDIVLIHDGARPLIGQEAIHRVVLQAYEKGAAVLAVPVKDSVKKVNQTRITETVERESLWAMQTPQAFRLPLILKAHEIGAKSDKPATDDAELVEWLGEAVFIVESSYTNIKMTTAEDLVIGERLLLWEEEKRGS